MQKIKKEGIFMIKVSETLYEAIKNFLNFSPSVAEHMESNENPHSVTKEQVGLGNIDNTKQATKAEFNAHTAAVNPHGVTKAQVGLGNVTNDKQATYTAFAAHTGNISNPHGVTKGQVGLGNVDNIKQAPLQSYSAHIAGTADKHSGNDVMYTSSKSVNQKIDELIVEGGGGTMYHDELLNRDQSGAHPIEAISGLRDEIGTTLVFEGTTANNTWTRLTCDAGSTFIDRDGYLTVPDKTALALDVTVIGVKKNAVDYVSGSSGGMWHIKAIAYSSAEGVSPFVSGETEVIKLDDEETNSEAKLNRPDTSDITVSVRGLADTTMYWRAEVKITNILELNE